MRTFSCAELFAAKKEKNKRRNTRPDIFIAYDSLVIMCHLSFQNLIIVSLDPIGGAESVFYSKIRLQVVRPL